jgi:hypothetical protein
VRRPLLPLRRDRPLVRGHHSGRCGRGGDTKADIEGGGGGVERPEGALRMRKRCLSDDARGELGRGAVAGAGVGETRGGGGSGPVGGGLGGTSSAGGMTCPRDAERGTLSTLVLRLCEREVEGVGLKPSLASGEICACWTCMYGAG